MIDIEVFKCFSLTKRSRITLEEGEYLGDMRSGLGVYSLYDFWVIVDENVRCGNLPSYVAVRSAEAVKIKPEIDEPFENK